MSDGDPWRQSPLGTCLAEEDREAYGEETHPGDEEFPSDEREEAHRDEDDDQNHEEVGVINHGVSLSVSSVPARST